MKIKLLKHVWIIYQDGDPAIWCTRKKSAEGYRCWGRRKSKTKINIVKYEITGVHKNYLR